MSKNELLKRILDPKPSLCCKIYHFSKRLTSRELEVVRKRYLEKKSVTKTASEMGVTPQGVVSFVRSIKLKALQENFSDLFKKPR